MQTTISVRTNSTRRAAAWLAVGGLWAALVACGGGGGDSEPPPAPSPAPSPAPTPAPTPAPSPAPLPQGAFGAIQYPADKITSQLDVVYSMQPNWRGMQYTYTVGGSDRDGGRCGKPGDGGQTQIPIAMDIYTPPPAAPTPGFVGRPVIIRVHGGGFRCGNKRGKTAETLSYAQAGYVGVSINYRLTDGKNIDDTHRTAAQAMAAIDLQDAIRYLRANATKYGIDPNRIATIGGSAGGGASLINAVSANDGIPPGLVPDLPPPYASGDARVQAAVSSGATLIDVDASNTVNMLTFDAGDAPSLILHADPQDPSTGATWSGNVLPTQAMFRNAGAVCEVVATPPDVHVVDMTVGTTYWDQAIYPFLRQYVLR